MFVSVGAPVDVPLGTSLDSVGEVSVNGSTHVSVEGMGRRQPRTSVATPMGSPDDRRRSVMDTWFRFVGSLLVLAIAISFLRPLLPLLAGLVVLAVVAYVLIAVMNGRGRDRW